MREIKLSEIRKMLEAGGRKAQECGKPSTVAIVDFGGHLRGLERPEGGRIANVDIAIKKAWTAIAFKRPTEMVRAIMMPDAIAPHNVLSHVWLRFFKRLPCLIRMQSDRFGPTRQSSVGRRSH